MYLSLCSYGGLGKPVHVCTLAQASQGWYRSALYIALCTPSSYPIALTSIYIQFLVIYSNQYHNL